MPGTITDTTVLSNFAQVRQPLLLKALFFPLHVTASVQEELERGVRSALVPECDWSWLDLVSPTSEEGRYAAELLRDLEPGESDCLAVAKARDWLFLTDDAAARRLAERLGLKISGTLGCLELLVQEGHLEQERADALLATMIHRGYRSPVQTLRDL